MSLNKKRIAGHIGLFCGLLAVLYLALVWNLRLSLEYQPVFLLTLVLYPLYLWLEKKGDQWLTLLSVAAGTAVAFFDFLTTETLTLLLPLILVMAVRTKEGRLSPMRESLRLIVTCGICWGQWCSFGILC